jgi:hypothetical protein
MKRFLIICETNWCGEEQTYSAWAENDSEPQFQEAVQSAAYDNFTAYPGTGFTAVIDEMFGTENEEDLTKNQLEEAYEAESEYYNSTIEEWDETRDEEEWDWYELIYDGREKRKENAV